MIGVIFGLRPSEGRRDEASLARRRNREPHGCAEALAEDRQRAVHDAPARS